MFLKMRDEFILSCNWDRVGIRGVFCKPNCSPLKVHKESAQKSMALMFEQTNVTYVAFLQPRLVISITTN